MELQIIHSSEPPYLVVWGKKTKLGRSLSYFLEKKFVSCIEEWGILFLFFFPRFLANVKLEITCKLSWVAVSANKKCDLQLYTLRVRANTSTDLFLNAKITRSLFLPIVRCHLYWDPLDLHILFHGFGLLL